MRLAKLVIIAGLLTGTLPVAYAAPIAVPNHSFESPSADTPFTVSTKIDQWTTYGDAPFDTGGGPASAGTGTFLNAKPGGGVYFDNAHGAQVAYIFSVSNIPASRDGLEQILSTAFAAGQAYELTLAVGLAGSTPGATEPLTMNLFYYDAANPTARNVVSGTTITNGSSSGLSQTTLKDIVVTTPVLPAGHAAVGKPIGIEIYTAGPLDTAAQAGKQYDFDNVRLQSIPEPASAGLAAVGGLLLLRGRGSRQS